MGLRLHLPFELSIRRGVAAGEGGYLPVVALCYSADRALWLFALLRRERWDDERCPPVEEYVNTFDI